MNTLFEPTGDYRYLSDMELIYNITNSRETAKEFNDRLSKNELYSLNELFVSLTPGRRKVAESVIEIYKRTRERENPTQKICSSQDIYKLMQPLLCDLLNEEFWVLLMNQANNIVKRVRLSFGGLDGTYADIRLVLKQAIMNNAVSLAVIHNHPSGQVVPSLGDKKLTQQMKQASETLNIRFIDHVIIGNGRYYSFSDEGKI